MRRRQEQVGKPLVEKGSTGRASVGLSLFCCFRVGVGVYFSWTMGAKGQGGELEHLSNNQLWGRKVLVSARLLSLVSFFHAHERKTSKTLHIEQFSLE